MSETSGRAMDYTLAVVDEGLLGLTSFRTPNLHARVLQARGARRLHLGPVRRSRRRLRRPARSPAGARRQRRRGSRPNPDEGKSRFPPVVRFLGPVLAQGRREARAQRGAAAVRRRGARHGGGRRRQRVRLGGQVGVRAPGADDPADAAARHRTRRAVLAAGVGVHQRGVDQVREARGADRCALQRRWATRPRRSRSRDPRRSSASSRCAPARRWARARSAWSPPAASIAPRATCGSRCARRTCPSSRFQRATLAPGAAWKGDLAGLRPRRHAGGDARGVGAAAHQPGWAPRVSHPLSARLPRADDLERVPAALSTGADQARPEPAARDREQHPRGPRAAAQPAAPVRRLRLLAGHLEHRTAPRLAQRLGHDLRGPLLPRSREGRIHACPAT